MPEKYSNEWQHNKGEIDRSNGKYDSPGRLFSIFYKTSDELVAEQSAEDAYNQGWNNTDKQSK